MVLCSSQSPHTWPTGTSFQAPRGAYAVGERKLTVQRAKELSERTAHSAETLVADNTMSLLNPKEKAWSRQLFSTILETLELSIAERRSSRSHAMFKSHIVADEETQLLVGAPYIVGADFNENKRKRGTSNGRCC
ncbi:hypothetical protein VOLCADRAFT_92347 [Volvox carteri f. nagariensis]|uniref:Uncharacterized protein n=1 Tax=Volvox carteri f. nagariensis TaxID=3068 RepID=D8TZF4_VOLCA|nr:uncharacterized protein VOLCADRAFT_92347 [Volvox carteri f. nagariensis]EFJ47171.1 hypothetical protein VOLCADRAFT_92347 [Volvox carteri f. nagariensis]|eukprot:XP_002951720.1 hypothetical protein VOLCADRAFT_92347 [Volvox carteri f. nagariensis]